MKDLFQKTFIVFFTIVFVFNFQSCKKEADPTKTELLTTEGGWTLTGITTNGEEIADALIDLTFQLVPIEMQTPEYEAELREDFQIIEEGEEDECEKDDVILFKTDGNILADQGALKCSPNAPQSSPDGTWSCSADEKQLIVTDSFGDVSTFEILSINSTTFTIRQSNLLTEEGLDLDFEAIEDLEGWEDLDGYDEFLATEFVITYTLTAN